VGAWPVVRDRRRGLDGSTLASGWAFTPDPPPNTYRLPGGYRAGYFDCGGVGTDGTWRLRGDPNDPMLVWFQQGRRRVETMWPDGYFAPFSPRLEVIGPDGRVFARDGSPYRQAPNPTRLQPCWGGDTAARF
jgi:hypothetical protein